MQLSQSINRIKVSYMISHNTSETEPNFVGNLLCLCQDQW